MLNPNFKAKLKFAQILLSALLLPFVLLLLLWAVLSAWFFLPIDLDLNLYYVVIVGLVLMPFLAGYKAGSKAGKRGIIYGFWAGFLLCLLVFAAVSWFFPNLVAWKNFVFGFVAAVFLGAAGGLCGVNVASLRQKAAKKEGAPVD